MRIDFGRLTEEEVFDLAVEALYTLTDDHAIRAVRDTFTGNRRIVLVEELSTSSASSADAENGCEAAFVGSLATITTRLCVPAPRRVHPAMLGEHADECDKCGATTTDLDAGFCPSLNNMGHDCGGLWHQRMTNALRENDR